MGRARAPGDRGPDRATSTRSAHEIARLAPEALLARWGTGARGAAARAARPARRARRCRGSARRCRRPRWRPRGSWRPGRTRSTCTTPSAIAPEPTDRIRHVAHLGVRTRDFAFAQHGLEAPAEEFRIELTAPSGEAWTWGPEDAAQTVRGSAYDFCLLVTQRVHRDDTDLVAVGADAEKWLTIAQAFAGPGRARGVRGSEDRQLLRVLRRPALRDARDARGRRDGAPRLPHR